MSSQSSIGDFGKMKLSRKPQTQLFTPVWRVHYLTGFVDSAVVVRLPSIRPVSNRCRTVPCVFNVCETIAPTTRVISTNE